MPAPPEDDWAGHGDFESDFHSSEKAHSWNTPKLAACYVWHREPTSAALIEQIRSKDFTRVGFL